MASDPTFWGTMGLNGGSAVGVPGINTKPYTILSQGTSSMAQKVLEDAAKLFPEFDGITNIALPLPADFANPSLDSFMQWHTAHQVKFLKEQNPNWQPGDLRFVTFGTSPNPVENQTFLLKASGRGVIHVNTMQATDIALLPLADQERLAELPAFRQLFSNVFGLWPNDALNGPYDANNREPPKDVAAARARVKELLDNMQTVFEASSNFSAAERTTKVTASNINVRYPNLFLDQLDILRQRFANMAIFDPDAIGTLLRDLKTRFDRIESYSKITRPSPSFVPGFQLAANSTDELAGVDRALNVFLRSEARLRDLATESAKVMFTGKYGPTAAETGDPNTVARDADAPMMVFIFQTQENYAAEAEAEAKSEELNQMNQLITAYTKIQSLLNRTLQVFDPVAFKAANPDDEDAVEKLGLLGGKFSDGKNLTNIGLTEDEMRVVSMFDSFFAKQNNNSFHPVEIDTNALRPTFAMSSLGHPTLTEHKQSDWNLFSSNLSQVSKLLSQDSQLRMDEINRISRGKNKNYELASDTLNKMTDILRSIVN